MSLTKDQEAALDLHNQARASAPGTRPQLTWSTSLAAEALTYAQKLASRNGMKHSSQRTHGENLACSNLPMNLLKATQYWIEEKKSYHGEKVAGSGHKKWGHYTQVIWPRSTRLGMGIALSRSGITYVVARYDKVQMKGKYPYDGSWSSRIPRNGMPPGTANFQHEAQLQYRPQGQQQAFAPFQYPQHQAQQRPPSQNQRLRPASMLGMIQDVIQDIEEIDRRRKHDQGEDRRRNNPQVKVVGAGEVLDTLKELWDRHQERTH